ncbi:hypothetical protein [Eggerthella sinensis]|nr:hypothetical protein [Eggerthella sinensis]
MRERPGCGYFQVRLGAGWGAAGAGATGGWDASVLVRAHGSFVDASL